MHRKPDWEARLAAYFDPLRARPFSWGRHDCCTFTSGAVKAMTGADPMKEFRGRYRSRKGSVRALRSIGAGSLIKTLNAKFKRVPAGLAQRGDVVMHGGLLGICLGAQMVAVGQEGHRDGLVLFERSAWIKPRAWRVDYEG